MRKIYLILVLLIAYSINAFCYELSAYPIGEPVEETWTTSDWSGNKRHIRINMDVYNLDATDEYGAPQATAQVNFWYIDTLGVNREYYKSASDHSPFKGPGAIGPFVDPGEYSPYTLITKLQIKVWRDDICQKHRSMAWARADLWW